ncbi:MAG: 4'-phosphopantetheinyl transferase superfamily protein [Culturomica sp.]|jgi:4'-phosphopantetheinyl transferase|nr:4'-phosphopantetheinyl transferase superfamily protein [Culturomica sp.]
MLKIYYTNASLLPEMEIVMRKETFVGRLLLAKAIADEGLVYNPDMILKNEHGKPYLSYSDDFFFNISHSGDYIVCTVSDTEVGIDVQKLRKFSETIALRYFHPNEAKMLETLEDKSDYFFTLWTAKEAYLKYLGSGLSGGLNSFEVVMFEGLYKIRENFNILPVVLHSCFLEDGYKCFVCSLQDISPQLIEVRFDKGIPQFE